VHDAVAEAAGHPGEGGEDGGEEAETVEDADEAGGEEAFEGLATLPLRSSLQTVGRHSVSLHLGDIRNIHLERLPYHILSYYKVG
jgi:hypothetical protein